MFFSSLAPYKTVCSMAWFFCCRVLAVALSLLHMIDFSAPLAAVQCVFGTHVSYSILYCSRLSVMRKAKRHVHCAQHSLLNGNNAKHSLCHASTSWFSGARAIRRCQSIILTVVWSGPERACCLSNGWSVPRADHVQSEPWALAFR